MSQLTAIANRLRVSISAESQSWLLFRIGSDRGRHFVGVFGTWLSLPAPTRGLIAAATCLPGGEGGTPHELFALLCVGAFVLANVAPSIVRRHGECSLNALLAGRPWVVLTCNVVHYSPGHLLNTLLCVLNLGPVLHVMLGCERSAGLLVGASLSASVASLLWHGLLGGRPADTSVGGSGVAMALLAANAALFPRVAVTMYGIELEAWALPLAHLCDLCLARTLHLQSLEHIHHAAPLPLLPAAFISAPLLWCGHDDALLCVRCCVRFVDVLAGNGAVDVAAHAGGAACGWAIATRRLQEGAWSWGWAGF